MRVLLLNPPVSYFQGVHYAMNPTLALPMIAAVLNQAGHTAEVADLEALGVSPAQLQQRFALQRDRWPDWVGFTCLTSSARGCRDAISALRASGYDGKIAVGGPHVSLFPQDPLHWGADLAVVGECEGNIAQLLEEGATGIRDGLALDITELPMPDWHHHRPRPNEYQGNAPHLLKPESIIQMSRGCPHRCAFCCNPVYKGRAKRFKMPAQIEAEIRDLKENFGIKTVFSYDDEIVGTKMPDGWVTDLADRLCSLNVTWKTQGRCNRKHVTLPILNDLSDAGCEVIMWGVESFSQKVLKAIKKDTTVADIWHSLYAAKEAGIKNWVFTMIGNLEETEEDLKETALALRKAYDEGLIDYRQTTVVTALPGTELYDRQVAEGWYKAPPESGPQMHQVYSDTPWLTGGQIGKWLQVFAQVCPVGN